MPADELWTVDQVAQALGITPSAARGQLSRWGISRAGTSSSPAGRITAQYSADEVRDAAARRPGRGARTDLRT